MGNARHRAYPEGYCAASGKIEANTLFIGVSPSRGDAVILLPPLVSRALKNDGTHDARRVVEHELGLCARAGNPVSCLEQTLDALDSMLR